jgi:hypothetical protein
MKQRKLQRYSRRSASTSAEIKPEILSGVAGARRRQQNGRYRSRDSATNASYANGRTMKMTMTARQADLAANVDTVVITVVGNNQKRGQIKILVEGVSIQEVLLFTVATIDHSCDRRQRLTVRLHRPPLTMFD